MHRIQCLPTKVAYSQEKGFKYGDCVFCQSSVGASSVGNGLGSLGRDLHQGAPSPRSCLVDLSIAKMMVIEGLLVDRAEREKKIEMLFEGLHVEKALP